MDGAVEEVYCVQRLTGDDSLRKGLPATISQQSSQMMLIR